MDNLKSSLFSHRLISRGRVHQKSKYPPEILRVLRRSLRVPPSPTEVAVSNDITKHSPFFSSRRTTKEHCLWHSRRAIYTRTPPPPPPLLQLYIHLLSSNTNSTRSIHHGSRTERIAIRNTNKWNSSRDGSFRPRGQFEQACSHLCIVSSALSYLHLLLVL